MVEELGDEAGGLDEEALRADYMAGMTYAQLGARYGVSSSQISWRVTMKGWPRRNRSRVVDRPMIITRLFRVLERQVIDLEMEMSDMAKSGTRSGDREVVLLGKLAGNLGKLMEFDNRVGEGRRTTARSRRMTDIHHKLIERIEQLKRG